MVHELLSYFNSYPTGGHLGVFKTTEKTRPHFYWPNFKNDLETFISSCEQSQKRVSPPKTHKNSLSESPPSYPFHHIGINFMGPFPLSNSNQHILHTPQPMDCSNNEFAVSDLHIVSTATKAGTLSQRFSNCSCNPLKLRKHEPLLLLMQSSSG